MDFTTPVGRMIQGSVQMQHQTDMETNQKLFNDDGSPQMGVFFSMAFPKVLPNGQPNTEFDQFRAMLGQVAAAAWPALFPQGYNPAMPNGGCINPRFSWKYQDGDGVDHNGRSVAGKAGFAGNHIIKFFTGFPVRCFNEGKFAPHEELQNPWDIIKRGFWIRVVGEAKTNNATGNQVPGIAIYPKLVSFVERGEEIVSGPDAQQAFGAAPVGWRPPATSSPIPTPGAQQPVQVPQVATPPVQVPQVATPPVQVPPVQVPQAPAGPTVAPQFAAQGVTWAILQQQGWTEELARQHGYIL